MCADGDDAYLENTTGTCPDCGGDVDVDGYTTEACCNYSPRCETCGWSPCDGSC